MKIINGDILSGLGVLSTYPKRVCLIQGCNCHHIMRAGLAKYLSNIYPEVLEADIKQTTLHDHTKLGTYSTAFIAPNFHILNCYTQFDYGRRKDFLYANYEAIRMCMRRIYITYCNDWEIRMPKIGCGLANGSWDVVEKIIEEELPQQDVTIYYR